MQRTKVNDVLKMEADGRSLSVMGWVRTFRSNRFISINDGSCLANLQAYVDFEKWDETLLKKLTTGAALQVVGRWQSSQ